MQKHFACLIGIAGFLCTVPTSLADPGLLAPRAAIQADYNGIYHASRHKDVNRAVRYFSTDFKSEDLVNALGNKTPPMDLAQLHQMAADADEASQTITGHCVIQRLVVNGNLATATVRHHVVVIGKPDFKTGKRFHGIFDATTRDTWKLKPQGWLMQTGRGISLQVKRYEN